MLQKLSPKTKKAFATILISLSLSAIVILSATEKHTTAFLVESIFLLLLTALGLFTRILLRAKRRSSQL
jgi:hypothetical protein